MKSLVALSMAAVTLSTLARAAPETPVAWRPIEWRGEAAFALTTARWKAVVSTERARLVHFGPVDVPAGFVYAPETRHEPIGWGGHRVWLGPQTAWSAIWPPPAAWEMSAAAAVRSEGARLEVEVPPSGEGWPGITRIYELSAEGRLACRVRIAADGTRAAQLIQILQVPAPRDLTVPPTATAEFPEGFVLLPPIDGRRTALRANPLPANVAITAAGLRLRQTDRPEKLGFLPGELIARFESGNLHVGHGEARGAVVGAPDAGFFSQVYLGQASTPVIELEQLSPLFKAGESAEFTMWLDVSPPPRD